MKGVVANLIFLGIGSVIVAEHPVMGVYLLFYGFAGLMNGEE